MHSVVEADKKFTDVIFFAGNSNLYVVVRARPTVYLFEQFMFDWKGPIALSDFNESESGSRSGNCSSRISVGLEQQEEGNDDLAEKSDEGHSQWERTLNQRRLHSWHCV